MAEKDYNITTATEPENDNGNDEYKNIIAIIERGFNTINANYDLVYGYINRIKTGDPKKAAEIELMILEQVPKDYSILRKMEKLRQIVKNIETKNR